MHLGNNLEQPDGISLSPLPYFLYHQAGRVINLLPPHTKQLSDYMRIVASLFAWFRRSAVNCHDTQANYINDRYIKGHLIFVHGDVLPRLYFKFILQYNAREIHENMQI
jgi:hypothetical protein